MNVVIVESAAKAKTINRYLGSDYKVLASYGHVRDLPSKNGSVSPDEDFAMIWESDSRGKKIIQEITKAVKGSDKLILATDPDREGEAISWHLIKILEEKKALKGVEVERVAFNAVTKSAIQEAINNPRELDQALVSAYLARRALDYLVGFSLSPVLWRKLPGSRSAGRVQSVALRLVCARELEIERFIKQEYWSVLADQANSASKPFQSRLVAIDGKKLDKMSISNGGDANKYKDALETSDATVTMVKATKQKRNPYAPFTTSTLQMDASRKLGFAARQTMQVAQKLYEGIDLGGETTGLITYMRTDGVSIVPEAIGEARDQIKQQFGANYVPPSPRMYKTKAKNAQEAHEAIRPTSFTRRPQDVAKYLNKESAALYKLIWQRAMQSQMMAAEYERTTVEMTATAKTGQNFTLRTNGSVILFDGFLALYDEGVNSGNDDDDDKILPALKEGESVNTKKVEAKQHFTEPPPRYSEASLVKHLEELGIGRPSTFASTLSVLQDRDYVRLEKRRFIPEDKGRLVTAFLENFFNRYVEYDFTADLEEKLDLISDNKLDWKEVLREFWTDFSGAIDNTKDLRITEVLDTLNEVLGPFIFPAKKDGSDPRACPSCDGQIGLKVGRFGAFVGCTNYPECRFTRQFTQSDEEGADANANKELGIHPESGMAVFVKKGRFGPYVQLGDDEQEDKPKRSSIPKGRDPASVDLEFALSLLSLPRVVGEHPETGKEITAGLGRYGPFVLHEGVYANLPQVEELFTIGINRAVTLLADKAAKAPKRAQALKELGDHPEEGGAIQVMDGRYGPYVKHGRTNATLPKDKTPESITLEEAVALIDAKAATKGKKKPKAKAKTKAKAKPKASKPKKAPSE